MKYDFAAIEAKWQKKWEETKPYAAVTGDARPKFYGLIEFPYPSAAGLHVGHPRPFTAMDIICRKKRMQGYNVLNPIGFDAFGLPTENFAIKNHIHPAIVTKKNIENFTRQLKMLGYSFDWDRVVDTTDPEYYKWTQWIFLQMYKHGLAYKTTMPVNWCTSCKCVLANEEVVEGVCERCGAPVIRKEKSQWMLRITKYADRLIDDLDGLDYIERVKTQQKNWIGRSTGTEVTFKTNTEDDITVYTTRVDTLFGVTYTVISPEHPLLKKWKPLIKNWADVEAYQQAAARKSDFERGELNHDKTGIRLEIIDGQQEARIVYDSHVADLLDREGTYLYVDVGGGSTEISLIADGKLVDSHSFDIGTVRQLTDTVRPDDWQALDRELKVWAGRYGNLQIIGSGGNINKLYRMARASHDNRLEIGRLRALYDELKDKTVEQRMEQYSLNGDRADVIVPAAEIFLRIASVTGERPIIVPTIGIIDGIVMDFDPLISRRYGEEVKHVTLLNITGTAFYVVMNQERYDSLPDDLKAIVDDMSQNYGPNLLEKFWAENVYGSLDKWIKDMGGTVHVLSDEDYARADKLAAVPAQAWFKSLDKAGYRGAELEKTFHQLEAKYFTPWRQSEAYRYVKQQ